MLLKLRTLSVISLAQVKLIGLQLDLLPLGCGVQKAVLKLVIATSGSLYNFVAIDRWLLICWLRTRGRPARCHVDGGHNSW